MVADLVTGGLGKIGEILVDIARRQFEYLIQYNRSIENLKEEVKKLETKREGVQQSKESAKRNGETIVPEVDLWLENVDHIVVEAEKFLQVDVNANKNNLYEWFDSTKLAEKEHRVTQLEKEGKFDRISNPAPSTVIKFLSSGDFIAFNSTKLVMKDVVEALRDDKVNFIGLHGMGGVGKTTLVKEIAKKAKEDRLFDNVVMVVVSQTVGLKQIQDQIAEMLGLNLNNLHSDTVRASLLHARLKDEKRILVILDDVWEILDVKAVGIPFGVEHEGCKVMITSRREQVCKAMGTGNQTTKIIHLGTLSESESLALFRRSVGDDIDDYLIKDEVNKVVRECQGLPIALVTVGRAMKGKDLKGWKEAVRDLKKSTPTNVEGVEQGLFRCLKLSYDYLRDEEAKSFFLLCSLFPEDHNIKIELLIRYGWGLGIFKKVDTIQEARGRAHSIFNNLKASCLLLEGNREGFVKMHDVVRDVAITIGSEMYHVKAGLQLEEFPRVETLQRYFGISLMDNKIRDYPDAWDCPNLQILLMQNSYSNLGQEMPEGVFRGMKTIKVLDRSGDPNLFLQLSGEVPITTLEPSFFHLSSLRTLILESHRLEYVTALGEIKTLEILSLAGCELKDQLNAVRKLQNLRLLDLTECRYSSEANIIQASGVISSLSSRLEELYLLDNYFHWECEGIDKETGSSISVNGYPSINELKSLRHLTVLTVQIRSIRCIPEDFVFPDILETFTIFISYERILSKHWGKSNYLHIDGTRVGDVGIHSSLNFIKPLLRKTNYLLFKHWKGFSNAFPDLLIDGNVLKTLTFESCDEVEYLIDATKSSVTHQLAPFYELKDVSLVYLYNFKSICRGVLPPGLCLSKLKSVYIEKCPRLTSVLSLQLLQRLQVLDTVYIGSCAALENVFDLEGTVEEKSLLSSLAIFKLVASPQLKQVWNGPTERLNLHNLRVMEIGYCHKLKFLFPPSIAQRLPKLEELSVWVCDKLELIVADEQEELVVGSKMVFPQLRSLYLAGLPELNAFSKGAFSFKWPSLKDVTILSCPKMKTFTCDESQSTLQLLSFRMDDEHLLAEELNNVNVNAVIQKRFNQGQEEMKKKTTLKEQRVTQLEKKGKFDRISNPASSTVIKFLSSGDFIAFNSTKLVVKDVVEALKDDKINFIGLHGMGGVGKTTIVKEIAKKAKEDRLFDNVVMAVVSQTVGLKQIQDQIAEMLDLNLNNLRSIEARGSRLHARLKDEKRILVILDDVWERVDVKAVGIPFGVEHEGCKIMITSRRKQVCNAMGTGGQTTKIIHLGTLSESESWALFRRSVGDVIDDYQIKDEASKVVRECRGLPIALVTVGRAMKGKDLKGWKEAFRDLKKSTPTNLEGVNQGLFRCLKLSYDYLREEEAKSFFLLCSLFPEDHNIKIELLIRYGWGLGIFKKGDTIQKARDRAHSIFNNLMASCLLLEGNREGFVKMHDVVRDVAISIGSEMYHVKAGLQLEEFPRVKTLQRYSGISLMDNNIRDYPDAWDCPNLEILLMQNSHSYLGREMPEEVFRGMKTIKVLDRSGIPITSLEPSFFHLSCLRTLILESCHLEYVTALGEIKTLEILSLAGCELKDQLNAVRQLKNLRMLDLTGCRYSSGANIIPAYGVISSLSSRLEELYLYSDKSFNWECEGSDRETGSSISGYPSINELKSLHHLTVLTIQMQSIQCIPEDFVFPDTIETFIISIGRRYVPEINVGNYLHINLTQSGGAGMYSSVMRLLKPLLGKTNYLSFEEWNDFSNALPDLLIDGDGLNAMKTLILRSCDKVEYLIDTTTKSWVTTTHQHIMPFYELEKVELRDLDNFKSIWHGVLPPDLCLSKLKSVEIRWCPMLTSVLSLQLLQRLHLLHTVFIKSCGALENVFDLEGENDRRLLSSLASLQLRELEELKHIWIGPTERLNMHSLREMFIGGCNKLKFLFPPAIAQRLPKLEHLWVYNCNKLEIIVADEEEERVIGNEAAEKMVFPKLRTLDLWELPELNAFSMGNYSFEWPSLEGVVILGCPKMKTFTCDESQTTPQLREFELDYRSLPAEELNVNVVIQNRFKEEEMKKKKKKTPTSSSDSDSDSEAAEARRDDPQS